MLTCLYCVILNVVVIFASPGNSPPMNQTENYKCKFSAKPKMPLFLRVMSSNPAIELFIEVIPFILTCFLCLQFIPALESCKGAVSFRVFSEALNNFDAVCETKIMGQLIRPHNKKG